MGGRGTGSFSLNYFILIAFGIIATLYFLNRHADFTLGQPGDQERPPDQQKMGLTREQVQSIVEQTVKKYMPADNEPASGGRMVDVDALERSLVNIRSELETELDTFRSDVSKSIESAKTDGHQPSDDDDHFSSYNPNPKAATEWLPAALGNPQTQTRLSAKRILVTGGAGFVGSHLVDRLMLQGHQVIVIDNYFTGRRENIRHWISHPNFEAITHDVVEPILLEVDEVYHLACPASPPHYQYNKIKTIKTSVMGTLNMLGLARRTKAKVLLASTSEVYGDPQVHPQKEDYWGHVNTLGPRACYDEGKRVAETMCISYQQQEGIDIRIARIFNTFGPRMLPEDGRVVSNFIMQALQDHDITIYGDGKITRSFQYVSDLVTGLIKLMNGDYTLPVNLGNPDEYTIEDFANKIKEMTKSNSKIVKLGKSEDDPMKRRPDITLAKKEIGWAPEVSVDDGLRMTIEYFQRVIAREE
eukprot:Clim_evm53s119 gene=Clim_evmTU53s119